MEPTHEMTPQESQIPILGYHAYVGIARMLGRGDDGFCPAAPTGLPGAVGGWTGSAETAQMYMPPLTPIT